METENTAYTFVGGRFVERMTDAEVQSVEHAVRSPIEGIREHFATALRILSDREHPVTNQSERWRVPIPLPTVSILSNTLLTLPKTSPTSLMYSLILSFRKYSLSSLSLISSRVILDAKSECTLSHADQVRRQRTAMTPKVEEILADPAASYWLKDALKSALARDPVDAANDAEVLARVLRIELNKLLQISQRRHPRIRVPFLLPGMKQITRAVDPMRDNRMER